MMPCAAVQSSERGELSGREGGPTVRGRVHAACSRSGTCRCAPHLGRTAARDEPLELYQQLDPTPPHPTPPSNTSTAEDEASEWRNSKEIQINGDGIPKPCLTFEEASMPAYVLSEVMKCGFNEPSPIQSQGWPMALLGRDMVGISKTGSGKTLAFLLPAMIHINAQVI